MSCVKRTQFREDALRPHLLNVQQTLAQQYRAVRDGGLVARGMMSDEIYRARFNLTLAEVGLMRNVTGNSGTSSPQVGHIMCVFTGEECSKFIDVQHRDWQGSNLK